MVKCLICDKEFEMITESHMNKYHDVTCKEYAYRFNLKKGELNPQHSKNMIGSGNPRYGIIPSLETRQRIREVHKQKGTFVGEKNPMYGKTHTSEVRKKISEYNKIVMSGKGNPFYGKKHTLETRKKISEVHIKLGLSKGKNNPLYGRGHTIETRKKQSKIRKEFFIKYPEKHMNSLIAKNYKMQKNKKGGYISKLQIEIYDILKEVFSDAQLNYPLRTEGGLFFADIGIPSLKLDIEYDSLYWHDPKKDEIRDKNISAFGWKVIRIKDYEIDKNVPLSNYLAVKLNNNELVNTTMDKHNL